MNVEAKPSEKYQQTGPCNTTKRSSTMIKWGFFPGSKWVQYPHISSHATPQEKNED